MNARTRVTNRSRSSVAMSRPAVGEIRSSGEVASPGFRIQHRTFFGAPPRDRADARSDLVFLGAPFDLGTTLRPGARFGPEAIRTASGWWQYPRDEGDAAAPATAGPPRAEGWYDLDLGRWILRGVSMADWGDVRITPTSLTANLDRITAAVRAVLDAGSFPVLIGGDHSVTYPAIRAFAGQGPLHLVQFDSHQDFNDERHGVKFGHGNVMRRASELPFVTGISQIGLRALQKYNEPLDAARRYGVRTVSASELRRRGPRAAAACVPPRAACYLTLDIDALDIAVAPGTGTPEPGGLTLAEMREAVRAIARRSRIVGIDLVEVAPPYDWAEVTARAGARLLLDVLSAIFDRPHGGRASRSGRPRRRPARKNAGA
jgi:agmatinase